MITLSSVRRPNKPNEWPVSTDRPPEDNGRLAVRVDQFEYVTARCTVACETDKARHPAVESKVITWTQWKQSQTAPRKKAMVPQQWTG